MNSKSIAFAFLLSLSSYFGFSQQSMSDYSFIEVPEVYEFLEKKDQYQLNSLTKFLFNKHGFNAYFSDELPNVRKCDGLYASLETQLGFIYTKITVVVKDCNGVELFRSAVGKSKLKEYRKTYHQALRNAFESFDGLGVNQKEIVVAENNSEEKNTNKVIAKKASGKSFPSARFSSYTNNGTSYLLRKTATGYTLSQEVIGATDDLVLVGTINKKGEDIEFVTIQGGISEAYFDQDLNLIIKLPSGEKKYKLSTN